MAAFIGACFVGDLRLVKTLLRRDPGLLNKHSEDGEWTPLISACAHGQLAIVKLLLDKGATVDLTDNDGITSLMF